MRGEACLGLVLAVVSPLALAGRVDAQGLRVDQSSLSHPGGGLNLDPAFGSFGQEFIPTFDALNAVDLVTADHDPFDGEGARLVVRIRNDTLTGEILATSEVVDLPNNFFGTTHFEFPSLVPVLPGKRHVLEIAKLSGSNRAGWGLALNRGYQQGELQWPNVEEFDVMFREGIIADRTLWLQEIIIPEPTSFAFGVAAGVGFIIRLCVRRTRARHQQTSQ